ncbi:right-handed parallel beta-helix repeat-containing protein [Cellulomonas sp.]|uniref:right-handed parallel beta-helix repeat-containing protein n=1 Tax=Cellulomonas sp. TaxID=40001 RepID=UPI001B1F5FD3|nr:right-handed parallel beta-helix repeat-containing protein [Cellulomonas sp.]MBO9553258.1 right-handed parallel beta-helix repeat-containing protein [Cellulomonas sp.]
MRGRHSARRPRHLSALVALTSGLAVVLTGLVATGASSAPVTAFRPADPVRVLKGTSLAAGAATTVTLPDVPVGTTAVTLQVTASAGSTATEVAVCAGTARSCAGPLVKTSTDELGTLTVSVPITTSDPRVTLTTSAAAKVYADLRGYTVDTSQSTSPANSLYVPQEPRRLATGTTLVDRGTTVVTIPSVPAGATAVALRLSSAAGATSTNVAACAAGASPSCSGTTALNPHPRRARQASVVVPLGGSAGNQIQLFNLGGTATLDLDLDGFYVRASTNPSAGRTVVSTKPPTLAARVLGPTGTSTITLTPPTGATAVHLRVRASGAWRPSVVTLCPGTTASAGCRTTALLTASPDAPAYGDAVVALGGSGNTSVTLVNTGASTRVAPEVLGWVVAPVTTGGSTPTPTPTPTKTPAPTPTPKPTPTATATATPKPTTTPKPTATPTPTSTPTTSGKPSSTNTGVPAGTQLTVHEGDLTITEPGTVIDSLDIRGFVKVSAANVTIRNSIVRGYAATSSRSLVIQDAASGSLLLENSELFAAAPSYWIDGVRGFNITVKRSNIHDVVDTARITGDNVRIESSWLHDNLHYDVAPDTKDGTHDDGIQIQRGTNIDIVGNTISGAYNAALMYSPGLGPISDVVVSGNWIDGGGCSVNIAEQGRGPAPGLVFKNNVFGRDTRVKDCAIIAPDTTAAALTLSGNTYTDGKVVTVHRGS